MKDLPIKEEDASTLNKKALAIISILVILGIISGLILSAVFVNEANYKIEQFNPRKPGWENKYPYYSGPLQTSDIIIPTISVVIVCISIFLLIGLIIVYIKIFLVSSSKYIIGLLLFLTPLLIQSIYSINALRNLFVSSAIPFQHIKESIGFGPGGLGGSLVIISVFEIIGLTILLYLSSE